MAYDTMTHDHRPVAGQRIARTLLVLVTGIFLGAMLMQVSQTPSDAVVEALQAGPIAGEDWHGNVRRSAH